MEKLCLQEVFRSFWQMLLLFPYPKEVEFSGLSVHKKFLPAKSHGSNRIYKSKKGENQSLILHHDLILRVEIPSQNLVTYLQFKFYSKQIIFETWEFSGLNNMISGKVHLKLWKSKALGENSTCHLLVFTIIENFDY